jgi:hypothetical protein
MGPLEIIIIILASLFVIAVIVMQIIRHKKNINTCSSECGCSQIEDMKRALKKAHESIKEDDKVKK